MDLPKESISDKVHKIIEAVIDGIPYCGPAFSALFCEIFAPPIKKRQDQWMEDVGNILVDLQKQKNINLDDLQKNEAFIDLVYQATRAALGTANEEKRRALRNAIRNSASDNAPEIAFQRLFIRMIGDLDECHLKVLKLYNDPQGWFDKYQKQRPSIAAAGLDIILKTALPEYAERPDLYKQIWQELNQRGLVNTPDLVGLVSKKALYVSRTTDMGKQFLEFIEG